MESGPPCALSIPMQSDGIWQAEQIRRCCGSKPGCNGLGHGVRGVGARGSNPPPRAARLAFKLAILANGYAFVRFGVEALTRIMLLA